MNKKFECDIFQDLYELYVEEEVEEETKQWMLQHESTCEYCQTIGKDSEGNQNFHEETEKIWGIRLMTISLYTLFLILAIWMSIWYLL